MGTLGARGHNGPALGDRGDDPTSAGLPPPLGPPHLAALGAGAEGAILVGCGRFGRAGGAGRRRVPGEACAMGGHVHGGTPRWRALRLVRESRMRHGRPRPRGDALAAPLAAVPRMPRGGGACHAGSAPGPHASPFAALLREQARARALAPARPAARAIADASSGTAANIDMIIMASMERVARPVPPCRKRPWGGGIMAAESASARLGCATRGKARLTECATQCTTAAPSASTSAASRGVRGVRAPCDPVARVNPRPERPHGAAERGGHGRHGARRRGPGHGSAGEKGRGRHGHVCRNCQQPEQAVERGV